MSDQTQVPERRIVVGVDGSPHSKAALRWAISQARLVDATVEALAVWQDPALIGYSYGGSPVVYEGDSIATVTEKVLAEAVAGVVGQQDRPVAIRSRGHGTFAGMLLGSVSQHYVQHAPCPVLVVPPDTTPFR
jgi:nucleotide-binding universal stress UspA family protein